MIAPIPEEITEKDNIKIITEEDINQKLIIKFCGLSTIDSICGLCCCCSCCGCCGNYAPFVSMIDDSYTVLDPGIETIKITCIIQTIACLIMPITCYGCFFGCCGTCISPAKYIYKLFSK
jgi:hypothetical protein